MQPPPPPPPRFIPPPRSTTGKSLRKRIAVAIIGGVLLLIAAGYVGLHVLVGCLCGNDEIREFPSPDGARKAVVYRRDCGATTDWSRQMVILPHWRSMHRWSWPDPVFITNGDMEVKLAWTDATHLEVVYRPSRGNPRAKVTKSDALAGPIAISYHPLR